MLTIYVLMVFSTNFDGGIGYTREFYTYEACQEAIEIVESGKNARIRTAVCIKDTKPLTSQ